MIVEVRYASWLATDLKLASHGKFLPAYVTKEFDEYLKCGRLEHGFLKVRCESSFHRVTGAIIRCNPGNQE